MNKKRKCIHVYFKIEGFDKAETQLIRLKFESFAEQLDFSFDPDYLSVSQVKEFENDL